MLHRNALRRAPAVMLALIGCLTAASARAEVIGVQGTTFALTAKADRISTPDGNSILIWGLSTIGRAQYPAPTLIVSQGSLVTISVTNQLAGTGQRVSLIFPGQSAVAAECALPPCVQGPLALEAGLNGTVTYRFTAARPGTFHYTSGSQPDLQIEMGLVGALIVRPTGPASRAYASTESAFDREYLFLLSEMDSRIHDLVEAGGVAAAYASGLLANYFPNYWFINGRNAPDTMSEPLAAQLPTQPYNAFPLMHVGDRVLMRVIGGGHDMHPFHHHGNHARVIARDGNLLQSAPGNSIDLSPDVFTIQSVPGQTVDAIFRWTGKDLGWDVYGDPTDPAFAHTCSSPDAEGLDPVTREYCADHGKPFPVVLPEQLSLTFGGFYSGSPFLGTLGLLPPGEGGMNPEAGLTYMWHSHTEKEITNFDVFPGGMMTMAIVVPKSVTISPNDSFIR